MYRRNQSFALTAPPAKGSKARGMRGLTVLGIVVNPRTKEPLLVTTDEKHVGIRGLKASALGFHHGSGYYDTSGHGKSKEAENLTGYPRSHTPSGVVPRGGGYGTSLYTALSLGAYLVEEDYADIEMDVEGAGISSESEGRSSEADKWWDAAHAKGLTDRDEQETEEEEEDVRLNVDKDDLESCVSGELDEGQTISYVNSLSVDIVTTSSLVVDTFPYYTRGTRGAWTNDLVVAEFHMRELESYTIPEDSPKGSELRWLTESAAEEPDFFGDVNPDALLALDVRDLDNEFMRLLSLCYANAKLKDKDIDGMWMRWSQGLDPSATGQQHLFSPNGRAAALSDVVEARNNVPWKRLASLP